MSRSIRLGLKARERLYVNGAVLRFDRRVSVELLNEAVFLLEAHVMQPEDTVTPLRQLYFAIQTMLMDPRDADAAALFHDLHATLLQAFQSEIVVAGLTGVGEMVRAGRPFEALKTTRGLFPLEAAILAGAEAATAPSFPLATSRETAPCP